MIPTAKKHNRETHGLRHHKFYKRWDSMMQRCYNPKHGSYKDYGARGIVVSDEFKYCEAYICYLENLPGYIEGLQVDRRDNNGNYERGNLKWSTVTDNNLNKRVRKDSSTNYTGVSELRYGKFRASLVINRIQKHIGVFKTIEEAVLGRNKYIIDNNLRHSLQHIDNIK